MCCLRWRRVACELVARFGGNKAAWNYRLRGAGVALRPRGAASSVDGDVLVADYQAGAAVNEVARTHRCTPETVQLRLAAAGLPGPYVMNRVELRGRGTVADAVAYRVRIGGKCAAFYLGGELLARAAERYGTGRAGVIAGLAASHDIASGVSVSAHVSRELEALLAA